MQNAIYRYLPDMEHFVEQIRAIPEAEIDFKPAPEAWSIHEIVVHLFDVEIMLQSRLKSVLAEENPVIRAFDQDLWAQNLKYSSLNMEHHLQALIAMRRAFAPVLEQIRDEDWERTGEHTEDGTLSARIIAEKLCVSHLELHVKQVQRNRDAYAAQK